MRSQSSPENNPNIAPLCAENQKIFDTALDPRSIDSPSVRTAKTICNVCPELNSCSQDVLKGLYDGEPGVIAGKTLKEREEGRALIQRKRIKT